jgi:hypothetical protein
MNGSASKANRAGVTLPCYPCDAMPSQAGPGRAWPNDAERSRTVCSRQKTGGVPCRATPSPARPYRDPPSFAMPTEPNPNRPYHAPPTLPCVVAYTGGETLPCGDGLRLTMPSLTQPCRPSHTRCGRPRGRCSLPDSTMPGQTALCQTWLCMVAPRPVISTFPNERTPVGRNDTVRNRLSHHAPVPVVGPQHVAAATEYP